MVRLVARKAFTHRGRSYRRGAVVEVSAVEAIALTTRGLVERGTTAAKPAQTDATAEELKKTEAPRRYRRRDLEAEE